MKVFLLQKKISNMKEALLIVAAGKSSRFGGYPKAFCNLGKHTNIENTIKIAKPFFKKIYAVINEETHHLGLDSGLEAEVIPIVTGQGDADSIIKALENISEKVPNIEQVTVCWGDAVFLSDIPFREMESSIDRWSRESPVLVGCCLDVDPYAWFDTKERVIIRAHFRGNKLNCGEGSKQNFRFQKEGLHDQSIFLFKLKQTLSYLKSYKKELGLDKFDSNSYDVKRGEMKLLDFFSFIYKEKMLHAAEYCLLTKNQIKTFNTKEELNKIIIEMK